ncbi:hypothetical protein IRJ41_020489, partial [Triplophysa rosa]
DEQEEDSKLYQFWINNQVRRESMVHKPDLSLDADICFELHRDECEGVKDEMFVHQSSVALLVHQSVCYELVCWDRK